MAIPLTSYLSEEGEYCGIDVTKKGIDWCQDRISPRFGNFHFQHSDVYNRQYNPDGKISAKNFQFPFEDESFDFIFLTSVFTHMLPADVDNYMNEISRVLKPRGKCLVTLFLLNEESEDLVRSGRSALNFEHKVEDCLTIDKEYPERAIAYSEENAMKLFETHGLEVIQPVRYGSWCKRSDFLSYQDIVVAEKR